METKEGLFILQIAHAYKLLMYETQDKWRFDKDRTEYIKNADLNYEKVKTIINRELGFINTNTINGSEKDE